MYCDGTHRVIEVEREENLEAVENVSQGSVFGEGRDRRLFRPGQPEDEHGPWCRVGSGVVASLE